MVGLLPSSSRAPFDKQILTKGGGEREDMGLLLIQIANIRDAEKCTVYCLHKLYPKILMWNENFYF